MRETSRAPPIVALAVLSSVTPFFNKTPGYEEQLSQATQDLKEIRIRQRWNVMLRSEEQDGYGLLSLWPLDPQKLWDELDRKKLCFDPGESGNFRDRLQHLVAAVEKRTTTCLEGGPRLLEPYHRAPVEKEARTLCRAFFVELRSKHSSLVDRRECSSSLQVADVDESSSDNPETRRQWAFDLWRRTIDVRRQNGQLEGCFSRGGNSGYDGAKMSGFSSAATAFETLQRQRKAEQEVPGTGSLERMLYDEVEKLFVDHGPRYRDCYCIRIDCLRDVLELSAGNDLRNALLNDFSWNGWRRTTSKTSLSLPAYRGKVVHPRLRLHVPSCDSLCLIPERFSDRGSSRGESAAAGKGGAGGEGGAEG